jgi:Undecaprenyl-phosphate glucose phosphotransferase
VLKQRHQVFVTLFASLDGAVITAACLIAWAVRRVLIEQGWPPLEAAGWLWPYVREPLILLAVPLALLVFALSGLYRPRRDGSLVAEQAQVVKASALTIVVLIVALWGLGTQDVGGWSETRSLRLAGHDFDAARVQIGVLALLLPLMIGLERFAIRQALRWLRAKGWNLRHVCIIGTGRLGRVVCRTLDRNSWTGIHVAYFVSHNADRRPGSTCCGRPVAGGLADLEHILEEQRPDAVYIALPTSHTLVRPELLRRLERYAVDVRLVPDIQPRYLPDRMVLSELDGMPVLSIRESPLQGLRGAVKRAFDALGALAALILFSPLMAAIAVLVRASGPGPVIFRQRRVSLGGEEFQILKFRTMYHAEDESRPAAWTTREDPRVTPIGRWLRRTSLDELPQLINVLLGDMSLVGPRPERPELIARFRDDWRGYMLRQHVKAGMTGWAQVNGLRGQSSLRKRLQLDLFYIRNWSLGLDLKILWLTIFRGFVNRNAH